MPDDYDVPDWVSERGPAGAAEPATTAAQEGVDARSTSAAPTGHDRSGGRDRDGVEPQEARGAPAERSAAGDRGRNRLVSAGQRGAGRRVRLTRTVAAAAVVLLLGSVGIYLHQHQASAAATTARLGPQPSLTTGAGSGATPSASGTPTAPAGSTQRPKLVTRGNGTFRTVALPALKNTAAPAGARVVRIAFQIEGGLGIDPAPVAQRIAATLLDRRGWEPKDRLRFSFASAADVGRGAVDITIRLASPDTTDQLCAPLTTNGYTSCFANRRAVLNSSRWLDGVPFYRGHLDLYRTYMVNHEVGHGLGHGHEHCPAPGARAPTMQQQTLRLEGCVINPYPMLA